MTQQSTTLADSPAAARRVPATRKEEALWLLESVVPGSAPNNLSLAFQADGRIRHDAAERALHVMLRRHEVLRTVYFAEGTELTSAVLAREDCAVEVSRGDISDMAELTDFVARPFALDGTPLLRAGVFRYGDTDVFCLAVHHLIFDTLSSPTLLKEFVAAYEHLTGGRELPDDLTGTVPALAHRAPTPESVAYWRAQLAGFDPDGLALRCGTDVAEPTLAGDYLLRDLSPGTTAVVRRLRKELRAPEAVILLAAYYQLLAAHGAGPDVVVGSPVDTRPAGRQDAVGYHVNVVPLRVRVDPALTFRQLVREAREVFFDSLLRADVPVDDLSAELPRQGSTWRNLLFRHLFNYVSELGLEQFTLAGMPARPLIVENGCSKFDLELFVLSSKERIRVRAVYGTEFFERDEVTSLLSRYERLLLTLGAEPDRPLGEFRVWSEQDEAVIDAANATRKDGLPLSQLTVLRERCLAAPETVAVIDGDDRLTHRGLWHAADAVRRLLTDHGVRRGDVVALAGRRSAALVAGVLGTWLAGAAYLPVEPGHPASRIALQLSDSGARVVLADDPGSVPTGDDPDRVVLPLEEAVASAGRAEPHGPPVECTPPDPEDAAYLIYTSGSTGTPKGTRISHRSLANLVAHFTSAVDPSPQDGVLWLTTFAFDISALELFVPLAAGSPVVVAPDEARIRGEVLRDLLDRHPVRVVQATPTTWQQVLEHVEDRLAGRTVLCGGEPAPLPLMRRLATAGCVVHHVYGPTETTVWSTSGRLPATVDGRLDVGRPIANTQVMVMDPAGRELPVGVRGELCIAGAGVALGYHDRPELTRDRFREHPRHGRYYRTGDEARWRPDGTVELLGRADRQVKLRGNRVELGEVEAALLRHPAVRSAAVVVAGAPSPDAALVAFVVTAGGADLPTEDLWEHMRRELPRAFVPQEFVPLEALPVNASQKVDHRELVRLADERRPGPARGGGPSGGHEDELVARLIELWGSVLERDDVDATTHFFANGGHSLLGALLVQRVEERLGVVVSLAELFSEPTPERLARRIRR